ncbi:MAG TPA: GMC family oxidoreductase N-terminal domain-containing protein [Ramlibacter sp.]|nr:GMC family oxidoreductase N-terminal domain-containing protein [Ramlibacter sp.]
MQIYDYIVVGAGSAGCVVASRLSEDPDVSVLLVEAGPPADKFWVHTPAGMAKLFFHKQFNWNYYTEPIPTLANRRMYWPRGRGLGGSSAINGMIFIRGHREDFDHWERLGNPGWGFEAVLPYFRKMEHNQRGADRFRGQGGPLWVGHSDFMHPSNRDFVEAAVRAGVPRSDDLNGELHDGVGYMQHTIRGGKRQSAYVAYVEPVRHRPNLTVEAHCHVRRVVLENGEAVGVEIEQHGQVRVVGAAREVVLSTGSLNSPQLLMLSGIGPGQHLREHGIDVLHELPGVGQNLQDHFYIHGSYHARPDSSYNRDISGLRKYWQGMRYLLTGSGYLSLGSSQVGAFVKSGPEQEYADLQISFRPMTFTYHADGRVVVDPKPAMGAGVYRVRPSATGTVTLGSKDPKAPPALTPNFLTHPEDVKAMLSGIRHIRRIMAQEPIASRTTGEKLPGSHLQTDDQLLQYMEQHGNCAFHPAGTCKMGRDPMAVVDERLRVRGVGRLRVVDASIMPRVTSGNTNAPSIMIGEKGADMVAVDKVPRRAVPDL